MAKRLSTQRIRKNRTYTYEQLAEELGVSPQTVRKMKPRGLRVMEGARPHLILGADVIAFAERLRVRDSIHLAADQLLCMRCHAAVRPLGMIVDYLPMTATRGRLQGFCEHCERLCNRLIASAALPQFRAVFEIAELAVGEPRGTHQT